MEWDVRERRVQVWSAHACGLKRVAWWSVSRLGGTRHVWLALRLMRWESVDNMNRLRQEAVDAGWLFVTGLVRGSGVQAGRGAGRSVCLV